MVLVDCRVPRPHSIRMAHGAWLAIERDVHPTLERAELQRALNTEFERSPPCPFDRGPFDRGPFDPFSEELGCGLLCASRGGWFRVDPEVSPVPIWPRVQLGAELPPD